MNRILPDCERCGSPLAMDMMNYATRHQTLRCTNPQCKADAAAEEARRIERGGRPAKLRAAGIPFPVLASLDDFGEVPERRIEWCGTWAVPDVHEEIVTVKFR